MAAERACEVCGASLEGKRADARFCSRQCGGCVLRPPRTVRNVVRLGALTLDTLGGMSLILRFTSILLSVLAFTNIPPAPAAAAPLYAVPVKCPNPCNTPPTKVLVFVEENHSYAQMRAQMPYLDGLAQRFSYATDWTATTHPSLPNYLAIAGGSTFGVHDDKPPAIHPLTATSVFGQALAAGKTATTYAESMVGPCRLTNSGKYAVKHNPWAYFSDERTGCSANDVPLTSFHGDAVGNRLPNVGMVIPNLCSDAHNCPLSTADNWLKARINPVLASDDFKSGRLVVVVTADEDDRKSGNKVLTVVMSAGLDGAHQVVNQSLTHYSLCKYLSQVTGSAPLGAAAGAPDMGAAFGL